MTYPAEVSSVKLHVLLLLSSHFPAQCLQSKALLECINNVSFRKMYSNANALTYTLLWGRFTMRFHLPHEQISRG